MLPADRLALRWPSPAALAIELGRGLWGLTDHLDYISRTVRDRIVAGDGRLIVTVPPRHGKSELISVWTAVWLLAMRPKSRIAIVTYGHQFSVKWGRKIRAVLREHADTLGVHIDPEKDAANEFETLEGGSVLCTGIGGSLIGLGFDLILIDDPHKSRAEAESATMRDAVTEFWQGTCRNRLEPGGSAILIMQRWHESDLVGFLRSEESGEKWELINLPAIAEEGDPLGREIGAPLWSERYDLEALASLERSVGRYNWASQYQQRPSPAGGSIFRRSDFRYFSDGGEHWELGQAEGKPKRVLKSACRIYQTADTALKAKTVNDWTVCTTYAVTSDHEILILDVARVRLEVPEQLGFLYAQRERWSPVWQGVEDKSSGTGLIQAARRAGKPFKVLKADVDKVTRAGPISIHYENGMVYHRSGSPWLTDLEDELLAFPNGAHDDQVDTLAYAGREVGAAELQVFF